MLLSVREYTKKGQTTKSKCGMWTFPFAFLLWFGFFFIGKTLRGRNTKRKSTHKKGNVANKKAQENYFPLYKFCRGFSWSQACKVSKVTNKNLFRLFGFDDGLWGIMYWQFSWLCRLLHECPATTVAHCRPLSTSWQLFQPSKRSC